MPSALPTRCLRLPPELHADLLRAAEAGERSFSDEVRLRLRRSLADYPRLVLYFEPPADAAGAR